MTKGPTPRQVARAENIARIKELALAQLAGTSAGELSLRAIARELNIVSSAIYRYFPSRDDLITALIVDAYDNLGQTLEEAGARGRRGPRRRWLDVCRAMREWALAEPHRFALVYGSSIPGYRAPRDTIAPAGRVVVAFSAPVCDELGAREPVAYGDSWSRPGRVLASQLRVSADALELDLPDAAMLAVVAAFARVIGALTLELNGHFVGGFEPADALFDALLDDEATRLGL
ncbi:hypothetical protein ASG90_14200 [Nocardioides sp. Soil797]|nr:hypothetical protein ASG90_14200 [Nocardioides sp. Soil797]